MSLLYWGIACTGSALLREWLSNCVWWFLRRCMGQQLATLHRCAFQWLRRTDVPHYDQPRYRPRHPPPVDWPNLSALQKLYTAKELSLSPDQRCGTVCQQTSDWLTVSIHLTNNWRHLFYISYNVKHPWGVFDKLRRYTNCPTHHLVILKARVKVVHISHFL